MSIFKPEIREIIMDSARQGWIHIVIGKFFLIIISRTFLAKTTEAMAMKLWNLSDIGLESGRKRDGPNRPNGLGPRAISINMGKNFKMVLETCNFF